MLDKTPYQALHSADLAARLRHIDALLDRLGPAEGWRVEEVGDGNLNLVFIVEGARGSAVVKQALPYARCVGESWPMSLDRAFYEYHAMTRLKSRDPGRLPQILHFDAGQALMVMDHLTPHLVVRKHLMAGEVLPRLAEHLGLYLARTLFRGSDWFLPTAKRKADVALFAGNVELCGITEDLVFSDPFKDAPLNRHTPGLEPETSAARADRDLKLAAQALKARFATGAETLLHGDLHTGSVMATLDDTKVIDAEFALYGPMGFDVGALLANLWMAYFAQVAHRAGEAEARAYGGWVLSVAERIWQTFADEFAHLWRTERTGMLGGRDLFEEAGDALGAEAALARHLKAVWQDTLGFAGLEIHRRILGLAHIPEFEAIADETLRATCERRALALGRVLAVERASLCGPEAVSALARRIWGG